MGFIHNIIEHGRFVMMLKLTNIIGELYNLTVASPVFEAIADGYVQHLIIPGSYALNPGDSLIICHNNEKSRRPYNLVMTEIYNKKLDDVDVAEYLASGWKSRGWMEVYMNQDYDLVGDNPVTVVRCNFPPPASEAVVLYNKGTIAYARWIEDRIKQEGLPANTVYSYTNTGDIVAHRSFLTEANKAFRIPADEIPQCPEFPGYFSNGGKVPVVKLAL